MAFTSPPGDPPRDHRFTWLLLPPLVMAGCVAAAAYLAGPSARWQVVWFGVVAVLFTSALGAEVGRRGRLLAQQRRQQIERELQLSQQLASQEAATARLADVLLPGALSRLHQGDAVEEVLADVDRGPGFDPDFKASHESMLRAVVEAVKTAEDLRESAQRAFVNIARRVQAIVHQQFRDLREMEERHGGEPEVFGDLLRLDHGTALIGRLADSISVLGGSRPGRQWQQDIPLFSILRGAMSRITDYQRVDLHSVMEVAVVGPVVEPLIHALAELLDNATRYSPPQTRVHLTSVEIQSGIAIEIEDGGVGLSDVARIRAERVLSNVSAGLDLADLGETPRLGLSVVGRLAQANRFQVSLRQSAYAGVRAVLVVPRDLITALPEPNAPAPAAERGLRGTPTQPISILDQRSRTARRPAAGDLAANGDSLPQRRRRAVPAPQQAADGPGPTAAAPAPTPLPPSVTLPNGSSAPVAPPDGRSPSPSNGSAAAAEQPGMWLAAFQNAVSGGNPAPGPARPAGTESSNNEGE
jgi:signal transduction histidine kinase